ncbi:MAG TPA: hypothetical protein VN761_11230, partial [Candidatus Polarisedimenticolia bacterium]|nr:hypothetical protein [Candidatus Polarisedimenticolia bacterium]
MKMLLRLAVPVCASIFVCGLSSARAETNDLANLAVVATPSALYCSGDTTVDALNDGFTPRSSSDARHHSYGNW